MTQAQTKEQGPCTNVVLIGMPGAGKSSVGVLLAKRTGRAFIDSDLLIQSAESRSLQQIVEDDGYLALRAIEEMVLLRLNCASAVIATGGSAAYSAPAMDHLARSGVVVFMEASLATVKNRVRDFDTRGIARDPNQSFEELFAERHILYGKYADITFDCSGLDQEETCAAIVDALASWGGLSGVERRGSAGPPT